MRRDAPQTCGAERRGSAISRSRRVFAQSLGGLVGVACAADESGSPSVELNPLTPQQVPPVFVAPIEQLEAGGSLEFEYPPGHPAVLLRLNRSAAGGVGPAGDLVAFHRACPHMGCPLVDVDPELGELGPCVCHGGLFDLYRGGVPIEGMASQPLVRVLLEQRSEQLYAVGIVGLPYGEPLAASHTLSDGAVP